jgi:hypothetical protein
MLSTDIKFIHGAGRISGGPMLLVALGQTMRCAVALVDLSSLERYRMAEVG